MGYYHNVTSSKQHVITSTVNTNIPEKLLCSVTEAIKSNSLST